MPHWSGKKSLVMLCPNCGKRGSHPCVKIDPTHYHWDETPPLFERIAGRKIFCRLRIKRCSSCGEEFRSVEMLQMFLHAMIDEINRLKMEGGRLQEEKNRLQMEIEIETDESDELRMANEKLEKQVDQLQAELACIKEALLRISDTAVELSTRKSMPQVMNDSPNYLLHQTSCANLASSNPTPLPREPITEH